MSPHLLSAAHAGGLSSAIVSFVLAAAVAYACGAIAQRKGRNRIIWFLLGWLFSLITLIVIAVLPRRGTRVASGDIRT
jgi:uncharacterized membrane protein